MKRMIIGIVIGLLIGTAGTALAAGETVQATFQKFVFKVNGEELQLEADPLVYQGTTYLPVRVVANMLGYDVTYKADSRTIEMLNLSTITNEYNLLTNGDDMSMSEVKNVIETESQLPDPEVWVKISDPVLRQEHGIIYIPKATGEVIIRKGDLEFTVPKEDSVYGERSGEFSKVYDGFSFNVRYHQKGMYFRIDELRAAGFID